MPFSYETRGYNVVAHLVAIDLFAGAGGLSLGLHRAGIEGLFAVEKDPMAFQTFHANLVSPEAPHRSYTRWPSWLPQQALDIEELLKDEALREHLAGLRANIDLICGGPPCQGFSVGGIRDGSDRRNTLPLRYLEFVALIRPRAILLENVEGMARRFVSKPGIAEETSFVDWLVSHLEEEGYSAGYHIVDASKFGVPQLRRRVIVFGVRRDELGAWANASEFFDVLTATRVQFLESKGLDPYKAVTVREAIDDLNGSERVICPDSPKFMAGTYKEPLSVYGELMRGGIPNSKIPDSHRFSNHNEDTLAFYRKVQETQPFGRLTKAFLLESGTKKDKKVLIDPDAPASTITTHPDEFIHYDHPRNISVREMARLQSFPDDFEFKGRYTINGPRRRFDVARCSQVGNAVPPFLGEALGQAVQRYLGATADDVVELRARAVFASGLDRQMEKFDTVGGVKAR